MEQKSLLPQSGFTARARRTNETICAMQKCKTPASFFLKGLIHPVAFFRLVKKQREQLAQATGKLAKRDGVKEFMEWKIESLMVKNKELLEENYCLAGKVAKSGKLAAVLKEQIGAADTKHIFDVGMYRASHVEEMKKTAAALGELLAEGKP